MRVQQPQDKKLTVVRHNAHDKPNQLNPHRGICNSGFGGDHVFMHQQSKEGLLGQPHCTGTSFYHTKLLM
jgi:hypothetical protein